MAAHEARLLSLSDQHPSQVSAHRAGQPGEMALLLTVWPNPVFGPGADVQKSSAPCAAPERCIS